VVGAGLSSARFVGSPEHLDRKARRDVAFLPDAVEPGTHRLGPISE